MKYQGNDLDYIDDYLEHYGRKGMKWYQHIYGEKADTGKTVRQLKKRAVNDPKNIKKAYNSQSAVRKYDINNTIRSLGKMAVGSAVVENMAAAAVALSWMANPAMGAVLTTPVAIFGAMDSIGIKVATVSAMSKRSKDVMSGTLSPKEERRLAKIYLKEQNAARNKADKNKK